jgi:serine/threonine-protein kinase
MACKALDYAHKQGVIHRDIKPSNIMLTKAWDVKITDFSIAKIKSEETASKGIIGSPSYMAPEQVKEEPLEEKCDIFSLGCVLYELLTGAKAFSGDNHFSVLYKITNEDPAPIRDFRSDVPEILVKIVKKALEKDPSHRYQSSLDFAYDLRVALRGLRGEAKSEKAEDIIDYVHNVPFFETFTREQVKEIMHAGSLLKIPSGKVIVSEGEIDDTFYIIMSGRATVRKNNKDISFISRGECFGERSYLSGQSRAATVAADTDCVLLKISGTLMDKSSQHIQLVFLKRFATNLVMRLAKNK